MLCNIIFTILAVLYVIAIYFFFVKTFPSFWKVCKSYVKYIRITRKTDFGTFLFVFITAVAFLVAYVIYIIGAALWMMNSII
jgi:hypothetical protein